MGKLKGMIAGMLKKKPSEELEQIIRDIQKDLESYNYATKVDGRTITVYRGAQSIVIKCAKDNYSINVKIGTKGEYFQSELDYEELLKHLAIQVAKYLGEKT